MDDRGRFLSEELVSVRFRKEEQPIDQEDGTENLNRTGSLDRVRVDSYIMTTFEELTD